MVRPEPGQHARMDVVVEVVHQERAEDRDVTLFDELIELVLQVHAGVDVSAFPKDIHHLSPHTHFWVAPSSTGLCDDVPEDAREYGRVRHGVPHEAGQELRGVDHG